MKKVIANMFIALSVLGGIPSLGLAAVTNIQEETVVNSPAASALYRVFENSIQRHEVYLAAGSAEISISGDGDTDLDLYVFDSYGAFVAKSTSYGDDKSISLTVYRSGYFTVKVVNRGGVYDDYRMWIQ